MIRAIRNLKGPEYDFFEEILKHLVGDTTLISARSRDTICEKLKVSVSTYWRRIEKLVEVGIMIKDSHGVYELNQEWVRLLTIDASKQEVKKQQKAKTQIPTHLRF